METIYRADDVKPDFEGLKKKWEEMLSKCHIDPMTLNPAYGA